MQAYLDKHGKPTDDIQCAGEFDHDAHMQKVNDYIEKMTDNDIAIAICDSDVPSTLVSVFRAYERKNKQYQNISLETWHHVLMCEIDAELIAYAERNI